MRNNTAVPAARFKALFQAFIPWTFIYTLLRRCGVRRRRPPLITPVELIRVWSFMWWRRLAPRLTM